MSKQRLTLSLGACLLGLTIAGSAMAAEGDEKPKKGGPAAMFKKLDKNSDGFIEVPPNAVKPGHPEGPWPFWRWSLA